METAESPGVRLVDGDDIQPGLPGLEHVVANARRRIFNAGRTSWPGLDQPVNHPSDATFQNEDPTLFAADADFKFGDIAHDSTSRTARPALMAVTVAIDSDSPKRFCKRRLA
jgi:hypothetical protein